MAEKGNFTPTYQQALRFGRELAPHLFGPEASLIAQGQEIPAVREYRQRAEARSQVEGREISPLEVVDEDIANHKQWAETRGDRDQILRRLKTLESTRSLLLPKKYTESQLILRDLFKAERELPNPPREGDTYRDFKLEKGRGLRVRLLHPDPPEHSVGADLIYETHWSKKSLVRLAVVQYKLWDGKKLLLSQGKNLEK